MSWQEWVVFGLTVLGAVVTVVAYIRSIEKHIDRNDLTLYGVNSTNGLRAEMGEMKRWREEFRAELPRLLQESSRHTMGNVRLLTDDLDDRVSELEKRR